MKRALSLPAFLLASLLLIPIAYAGMASSSLIGEITTSNPNDVVANLDSTMRVYHDKVLVAEYTTFTVSVDNGARPGTYVVSYEVANLPTEWTVGDYSMEWVVDAKDVTDPVQITGFTYYDKNSVPFYGEFPPRPFDDGAIAWISD